MLAADPYSRAMPEGFAEQIVSLPSGDLRILQPDDSAELPDDAAIEWAPVVPYWSVLWRSGLAMAREVDVAEVDGLRVVELGCGLAATSIAAARRGAEVLATDIDPEGLALAERNAHANGVQIATAVIDWAAPEALVDAGPFDLVLASDVLYERASVGLLLSLLPRLAPHAWVADPGRPPSGAFLEEARSRWKVETESRGVVDIHRIDLAPVESVS
jgi:predicted nicotinamide N-methyase